MLRFGFFSITVQFYVRTHLFVLYSVGLTCSKSPWWVIISFLSVTCYIWYVFPLFLTTICFFLYKSLRLRYCPWSISWTICCLVSRKMKSFSRGFWIFWGFPLTTGWEPSCHTEFLCLPTPFLTFRFRFSGGRRSGSQIHDWLTDLWPWIRNLFQTGWSFWTHTQRFFWISTQRRSCCFNKVVT